jgi:tRNA 2-thiouridine synthesizing protein E
MPVMDIAGQTVQVNEEGFLTEFNEWNEEIAKVLATNIGVELTDEHWALLKWLRDDFKAQGETATTRRLATAGGFEVKKQFELFPKKPGKKMSYIAGLPKPHGCV